MAIKALMVDVDGVLIDGRPSDGLHWQTSVEEDFGVTPDELRNVFFDPHWDDIVLGRVGLMERLTPALQEMAPHVSPAAFLSYWFEKDSRISVALLQELTVARTKGIRVYLTTNQEHLRAAYLMGPLGLAEYVDDIFYSARLGVKKPDDEFFTKVQAGVGLRSEELLLIDDSRQNILSAKKAGWQTLHWTRESSPGMLRSLCE